jgi:hypothetical protein
MTAGPTSRAATSSSITTTRPAALRRNASDAGSDLAFRSASEEEEIVMSDTRDRRDRRRPVNGTMKPERWLDALAPGPLSRELAAVLRDANEPALRDVIERWADPVFALAMVRLGNPNDAEALTTEIFVRAIGEAIGRTRARRS